MIEKVTEYIISGEDYLKNLVTGDSLIINHVVMKPGQSFPAHVTENNVYIIISKGEISIKLDNQPAHAYKNGQMVSIPHGVVSGLSNPSEVQTELFVVKSIVKK